MNAAARGTPTASACTIYGRTRVSFTIAFPPPALRAVAGSHPPRNGQQALPARLRVPRHAPPTQKRSNGSESPNDLNEACERRCDTLQCSKPVASDANRLHARKKLACLQAGLHLMPLRVMQCQKAALQNPKCALQAQADKTFPTPARLMAPACPACPVLETCGTEPRRQLLPLTFSCACWKAKQGALSGSWNVLQYCRQDGCIRAKPRTCSGHTGKHDRPSSTARHTCRDCAHLVQQCGVIWCTTSTRHGKDTLRARSLQRKPRSCCAKHDPWAAAAYIAMRMYETAQHYRIKLSASLKDSFFICFKQRSIMQQREQRR